MAKRNWPMLILAAVVAFALGLALARAFQVAILASAPPQQSISERRPEAVAGEAVTARKPTDTTGATAPAPLPTAGPSSTAQSTAAGKALFQKACATCHGIGSGDRIGPDLAAVSARRERAWLIKAITAPDRMRLERDPITLELYEKFNRVDMPNLGLGEAEAAALIAYIDAAGGGGQPAK